MTYFAYLRIFSGPSSLRHFAVAAICKKWRTSEDVLYSSDRAQKVSREASCLLLALQGQTASKVQQSGYGHGSVINKLLICNSMQLYAKKICRDMLLYVLTSICASYAKNIQNNAKICMNM